MFSAVSRLFESKKDKTLVANAVKKAWITAEEYKLIVGEEYVA